MSLDLLEAFGTDEHNVWTVPDRSQEPPAPGADDDFGDFEDPVRNLGADIENSRSIPAFDILQNPDARVSSQTALSNIHGMDEQSLGQDSYQHSHTSQTIEDNQWGGFERNSILFDADAERPETVAGELLVKVTSNSDVDFDGDEDWKPISMTDQPLTPDAPQSNPTDKFASSKPRPPRAPVTESYGPPPCNLPPPATFLAYITTMFDTLPLKFKQLTSSASLPCIGNDDAGEKRVEVLQKHVSSLRASGRVIAGRKLRWKRDTILSQSMKIGPAGSTGMKVSNLDKNETLREDREVAEALHVWKRYVGLLRSLVAKGNTQNPGLSLSLPEIAQTMLVRKAKADEGALTATKSCIVCGLNRDERIARLDVNVEDSFGEWWIEHWGHVDCVTFWNECKDNLPHS